MRRDLVFRFGDHDDGVIGIPCVAKDDSLVEASYFFGTQKPKNIIVISSQVSCPMGCTFCELGTERFKRNLTPKEIFDQVGIVLNEAKKEGFSLENHPHKITIANTGEPLLNREIVQAVSELTCFRTSLKISTVFPDTRGVTEKIEQIAQLASKYPHPIQLQVSLISTSEEERRQIAGGRVASFATIRRTAERWRSIHPEGRKINLSLILTNKTPCDVDKIADIFPAELFRFRFREYVPTSNGEDNGLNVILPSTLAKIKNEFGLRGYEITDWASPSPVEKKFSLTGNAIRKMYLNILNR